MWMVGETVFTEAELKAYLRPKPKKKDNSIPRALVGSGNRAPLCPECSSHMPLMALGLRKAILEAECGGWLREEDAALMSAIPVPVGVHEGNLPDLPACLDRRGSKTGTVAPELFKEAA
jgi:hypothetical protein